MSTDSKSNTVPVREFMIKEIITVQSYDTIKDVCKKMYAKNISSAIIIKDNKPFGIVTYTDIAIAVTNFEKSPNLQISEIMSSKLVSVGPEESILSVAEKMTKTNTHHMLVLENDSILGVISSADLVVILSMLDEDYLFEKVKRYFHSQG
ncbi:MAG: CBS domain-containing protein [Crenarchaeota archaeon]|nr:MAG: CBS domain-containing protein [Thermoproteota archaeon]RDJ33945.1 MAG: CBS domain-containing protein [Thermoproteota archaeon]